MGIFGAFTDPSGSGPLAPERPAVVMLEAEGVDVVAGSDVSAEPWDSKKQRVESAPATGSVFPLSAGIEAHVGADSPFFGDALEVPSLVGEGLT